MTSPSERQEEQQQQQQWRELLRPIQGVNNSGVGNSG
eukprot:CAMPEP_0172724032 /NCGR_PEP_ID=MMETSP1074-20121228/85045_1 /TAXON_ID=2916 /ORGANISM="Ceratium fusus, Strain PA161109" /LENGTH=36 /DNA_ID= /DNA_START= /DNA_END= /DNA_ORIENTATION=